MEGNDFCVHLCMLKKAVIAPVDKRAIAFVQEIERRKAAIRKKLEAKTLLPRWPAKLIEDFYSYIQDTIT
jgi:hypothetical protein